MTRILITNLEINNVPIPQQVPPPRELLRWDGLDMVGGHHVEGSVLVLHTEHLLNNLLGRHAATEQGGGCQVASIQGSTALIILMAASVCYVVLEQLEHGAAENHKQSMARAIHE